MAGGKARSFLDRPGTKQAVAELGSAYGIPLAKLEYIINGLFAGEISDIQVPAVVQLGLGMSERAAYEFAEKLTEDVLDPVRDEFGAGAIDPYPTAAAAAQQLSVRDRGLAELFTDIKKRAGITITEDVLERRFRSVVLSWIRQVRDDIQTRQTALRETRVGGLGFDAAGADRFIDALRALRDERGQELRELAEEQPAIAGVEEVNIDVEATPPLAADTAKKTKIALPLPTHSPINPATSRPTRSTSSNPVVERIERTERIIESHKEIAAPKRVQQIASPAPKAVVPPAVTTMVASAAKNMPEEIRKEIERSRDPASAKASADKQEIEAGHAPAGSLDHSLTAQTPPSIRRPVTDSGRPRMADVRAPQKLYGPVDELAALTVADFRRLSSDPAEAVRKIRHKLALLEDESLTRRAEGIQALQKSPLYRAYAQRMMAAVNGGTAPGDLTDAELRAILELNKKMVL